MANFDFTRLVAIALLSGSLGACAVSPETQAKMDEYARTIPTCTGAENCQSKWNIARAWVNTNADFGIRSVTDDRILSTTNNSSDSGIGITVNRVPVGANQFQIVVDLECIMAYGCPDLWEMKLDFNRTVNAAN